MKYYGKIVNDNDIVNKKYVDNGITNAANLKTNTSVLPNNNGEIKTKYRIANRATGTTLSLRYFPLCKFPKNNSSNYASAIIKGRIGGMVNTDMSSITALCWNRGGSGIALFDIMGGATATSNVWNLCDIVMYNEDDGSSSVYLKCQNWFTYDLDLELYQWDALITYDGTSIESPTGTLAVRASTSNKRVEMINGKLLINGEEVAIVNDIPTKTSDLTNDNGFITANDNITGNAATATKATNDKNGNRIDTTYMTISNPTGTGNFIMNEGTHKSSLGNYVTLEGYKTDTSESYTHAEGYKTKAYGMASHTEGWETVAGAEYQHVQGIYNVYDSLIAETAIDIIGNGTSDTERRNIELTTKGGTKRLKGNVYVECNDDSSGGKKVATEEYVSNYHDNAKQDKLVSGTNVKTINNQSILGSGNITIQGGGISLDILQPFEAIV